MLCFCCLGSISSGSRSERKEGPGCCCDVIDNVTMTAGQAYEAMSNAGYLDSNMIVILNDNRRHSLHPNMEDGSKASISALSSIMSKIQSSQFFRKFRELAKVCILMLSLYQT